jgi:hypothetical protein
VERDQPKPLELIGSASENGNLLAIQLPGFPFAAGHPCRAPTPSDATLAVLPADDSLSSIAAAR